MQRRADEDDGRALRAVADHDPALDAGNGTSSVDSALLCAGHGDTVAFTIVYDQLAARVHGPVRRVVRELLSTPVPTVKTRMRDGLIRLRATAWG